MTVMLVWCGQTCDFISDVWLLSCVTLCQITESGTQLTLRIFSEPHCSLLSYESIFTLSLRNHRCRSLSLYSTSDAVQSLLHKWLSASSPFRRLHQFYMKAVCFTSLPCVTLPTCNHKRIDDRLYGDVEIKQLYYLINRFTTLGEVQTFLKHPWCNTV